MKELREIPEEGGPGARQAIEAVATSQRWNVLQEMNADGDPEMVWRYADAMQNNSPAFALRSRRPPSRDNGMWRR